MAHLPARAFPLKSNRCWFAGMFRRSDTSSFTLATFSSSVTYKKQQPYKDYCKKKKQNIHTQETTNIFKTPIFSIHTLNIYTQILYIY